jgi:hypothetical protein
MERFADREVPAEVPPHIASFYKVNKLRAAVVSGDPVRLLRAREIDWVMNDWNHLSILHFLLKPSNSGTLTLRGAYEDEGRTLLADALKGWRLWMVVHFDHTFETSLTRILAWLDESYTTPHHAVDCLVMRFWLERMICEYCGTLKNGSRYTRFNTIDLREPGAHFRFLRALEDEVLDNSLVADPFPHQLTMAKIGRLIPVQMWEGGRQTADQTKASTGSPCPGAPPSATVGTPQRGMTTESAQYTPAAGSNPLCAWHLAEQMGVADNRGTARPCIHKDKCCNQHVSLSQASVADALGACEQWARGTVLRTNAEEWIHANHAALA